jgi:hypothetical protein
VRRLVNSAAAIIGDVLQRLDGVLRTWATAGVLLLILALALAGAMLLDA